MERKTTGNIRILKPRNPLSPKHRRLLDLALKVFRSSDNTAVLALEQTIVACAYVVDSCAELARAKEDIEAFKAENQALKARVTALEEKIFGKAVFRANGAVSSQQRGLHRPDDEVQK